MYLPAFPALALDLKTSAAAVSNTLAIFLFGMGLGQALTGPVVDRYGRRRPLIGGLIAYALLSVLCALAPSIGWFTAARGLAALAVCMTSVSVRAMVRDLYDPTDSARVMSAMMLISGLAPILAPLSGSLLLLIAPWRAIFWLLTTVGLLLACAVWRTVPDSQAHGTRRSLAPGAVLADYLFLLRRRDILVPSLAAGLSFAGLFAYIAGTPDVLIRARGLDRTVYSLLFGLNALGMVVASQWNKRWVLRLHPGRVLRRALRVQATCTTLALLGACWLPLPLPVLCLALFAYVATISLVAGNASVLALTNHGQRAGKAAALSGLTTMIIGSGGAAAVGWLNDGTERPILALMAAGSLASLALLRLLPVAAEPQDSRPN
jgi:DHA1 family bicyclomycin/chloramphenicol resistance-like MFS transporter